MDHPGVGNPHDAECGRLEAESERFGDMLGHGLTRQLGIERDFTAQELTRVQYAEDHGRVCDCG